MNNRPFILHLLQGQPEAAAFDMWREGRLSFEEAVIDAAKRLFLTKQNIERLYEYIPPAIRAEHSPELY